MCLKITDIGEKSLKKKFEQQDTITAYKVLEFFDDELYSPFRSEYIWNYGAVVSNRKGTELHFYERDSGRVEFGIHVVLSEADAGIVAGTKNQATVILPVQCHKDDFVAEGEWSDRDGCFCGVFTKVTVKQEDYDAAIATFTRR